MFRPFYSLMEGMDRVVQLLLEGVRTRGRRFRWFSRITGLAILAMAVTQLIPTLADESTPPANEQVIAAEIPAGETVVVLGSSEDLSASGGDNSAVQGGEADEITYATSETETETTDPRFNVEVADEQTITLRLPSVLRVDPRAVTAALPAISIAGEGTLLLCIRGEGLRFDLANKGFVDDATGDELIVDGDLTGSLRISGGLEQVTSLVNQAGGLRIWSTNRVVAGKDLTFAATALTGVSTEEQLCGGQANLRTLQIRPLGIGMETKKSDVRLN